jgi:L-ascorbate metabolism protein UlaG (beta-lactamase superfamily)
MTPCKPAGRFTASFLILCAVPAFCADVFPASGGDITVTPITHASVQLEHGGTVIQVDPWSNGDYSHARAADLILITGMENDHLDPDAIRKIRKPETAIVIPGAAKAKIPDGIVIENGEVKNVAGIRIEAVASYDLIPGTPFHPKGGGNGYIITLGDKRIYFSGVTECVPEVQAVRNIDVAFVVMNSPHGRMTAAAAAECVSIFKPKVVYPYHYRTGNVADFKTALQGTSIDVRLTDWYPAAAAK